MTDVTTLDQIGDLIGVAVMLIMFGLGFVSGSFR